MKCDENTAHIILFLRSTYVDIFNKFCLQKSNSTRQFKCWCILNVQKMIFMLPYYAYTTLWNVNICVHTKTRFIVWETRCTKIQTRSSCFWSCNFEMRRDDPSIPRRTKKILRTIFHFISLVLQTLGHGISIPKQVYTRIFYVPVRYRR